MIKPNQWKFVFRGAFYPFIGYLAYYVTSDWGNKNAYDTLQKKGGGQKQLFTEKQLMEERLQGKGPVDLKELKKQTDAKRRKIAEDFLEKENQKKMDTTVEKTH